MTSSPFRQLMVVRASEQLGPNTVHMLVTSTAPKCAEDQALTAGSLTGSKDPELADHTESALKNLRIKIAKFLASHPEVRDRAHARRSIKVILNIHGYSTPLQNFAKNSYEITERKFSQDLEPSLQEHEQTPVLDDFVIFIDYSWPSEHLFDEHVMRSTLSASPVALRAILALGLAFVVPIFWIHGITQGMAALSILGSGLIGISLATFLLRIATYFRDRERAASSGVFDAVELVRWVHEIIRQERGKYNRHDKVELSLLAHSMGCFVATQLIRTLCDVFDPKAIDYWRCQDQELGPFAICDPCSRQSIQKAEVDRSAQSRRAIGELFELGHLVLASPDIPVWALAGGRSNLLQSSLRRFKEVFVFTNDADMVLRLASTAANFFVFPSRTRRGGYRLGNITLNLTPRSKWSNPAKPENTRSRWQRHAITVDNVGLHTETGWKTLAEKPFKSSMANLAHLHVLECTDYVDIQSSPYECTERRPEGTKLNGPRLSAMLSGGPRQLRLARTAWRHFIRHKIDSHGGYFQGPFCLDLIYFFLLHGADANSMATDNQNTLLELTDQLEAHQISWGDLTNGDSQKAECKKE